jgi:fused signal recognition particle receptor
MREPISTAFRAILHHVAAQTDTVKAATEEAAKSAPVATSGSDVVGIIALTGIALFMVITGWLFLRKKRKERLEMLTEASTEADAKHDLDAAERRLLEEGKEQPVPRADDSKLEKTPAKKARPKEDLKPLGAALAKTRGGFVSKLGGLLGGKKDLDGGILEELEAILFTADIGARTAERLLESVREKLKSRELTDGDKVTDALKAEMRAILDQAENTGLKVEGETPRVFMIVGVNGSGKTTTIGKLAAHLSDDGRTVLLGAGDTFRAAAAEQLGIWAERTGAPIVSGKEGADPSSVLFDAVEKGKEDGVDVVLCDTAGRLHTKSDLMEEMKKVNRVLGKACPGAPHEVILVLDSTTGQNAIAQAKEFSGAVDVTGIILTKLDGTAKGGVVVGIVDELKIPVRYIGVGEQVGDLRRFDPEAFVDALFDDAAAANAA